MRLLVVDICCGPAVIATFKSAIGQQVETVLDQLDFRELTPVHPETGENIPEEQVAAMGGKPTRAEVPPEVGIQIASYFKPDGIARIPDHPKGTIKNGEPAFAVEVEKVPLPSGVDVVEIFGLSLEAALTAIKDKPKCHVVLTTFPLFRVE